MIPLRVDPPPVIRVDPHSPRSLNFAGLDMKDPHEQKVEAHYYHEQYSPWQPQPPRRRSRVRTFDDESADYTESDGSYDDESGEGLSQAVPNPGSNNGDGELEKLAISKSPVMEALVFCALKGWGIHLIRNAGPDITFKVDDFELYCKKSQQICSKQHPTSDRQARIKALKRWFPDFPNRRDVPQPTEFYISVAKDKDKLTKIRKIIEKNKRFLGVKKVRRMA
jgi:hypothetical protein